MDKLTEWSSLAYALYSISQLKGITLGNNYKVHVSIIIIAIIIIIISNVNAKINTDYSFIEQRVTRNLNSCIDWTTGVHDGVRYLVNRAVTNGSVYDNECATRYKPDGKGVFNLPNQLSNFSKKLRNAAR